MPWATACCPRDRPQLLSVLDVIILVICWTEIVLIKMCGAGPVFSAGASPRSWPGVWPWPFAPARHSRPARSPADELRPGPDFLAQTVNMRFKGVGLSPPRRSPSPPPNKVSRADDHHRNGFDFIIVVLCVLFGLGSQAARRRSAPSARAQAAKNGTSPCTPGPSWPRTVARSIGQISEAQRFGEPAIGTGVFKQNDPAPLAASASRVDPHRKGFPNGGLAHLMYISMLGCGEYGYPALDVAGWDGGSRRATGRFRPSARPRRSARARRENFADLRRRPQQPRVLARLPRGDFEAAHNNSSSAASLRSTRRFSRRFITSSSSSLPAS